MKSIVTQDFLERFAKLPKEVQETARRAYRFWRANPAHPGLNFKPIQGHSNIYSVRVGRNWRAVGKLNEGTITWFWIGSHAEYDQLIS